MTTRSKPFRCVALAAFLSIGVGLIWGVAFLFSISIAESTFSSFDGAITLCFTRNGTPVVRLGVSYDTAVYHDLDGNVFDVSSSNLTYTGSLSSAADSENHSFRPPWSKRVKNLNISYYAGENWFWVCDDQYPCHCYLVGYDKLSKTKIGYLGRNGFQPDEPAKEEQFLIDVQTGVRDVILGGFDTGERDSRTYFLLTTEGVVGLYPKDRTVELVMKNDDLVSGTFVDVPETDSETAPNKAKLRTGILLRTSDRVLVFDPQQEKEIRSYVLPEELRSGTLTFVPLPDGQALVSKEKGDYNFHYELFWIDTAGKIVKQQEVDLHRWSKWDALDPWVPAFYCPSPGTLAGVLFCYPWGVANSETLGYGAALGKALGMLWPVLVLLWIVSGGLAVLCYRRHRRYGLEWTWVWVGFVFLFGVPAYLGYLAHRTWSARLPCPNCGELAPRDREACLACHEKFPAPALKGTEVFA